MLVDGSGGGKIHREHGEKDGWLEIRPLDDEAAGRMSLALAQQGIGIVRMEERSESLEDIFLALTGTEASL